MAKTGANPRLSIVVAIVSDTTDARCDITHLVGNLEALTQQVDPPPLEVIVPYHQRVEGIEALKVRFPDVTFIPVTGLRSHTGRGGSREHHDELRARGLAAARGEIVGLLEDHGRPDLQWCKEVDEAHRRDCAAVGGAIENGIDRLLNWAVYFCDFYKYQNPVPEDASSFVSDANVAYKRAALKSIEAIWQDTFHETTVNSALMRRGEKLLLSPRVIVYQHRRNLRFYDAIKERFVWGRSYAVARSRTLSDARRLLYAILSPLLPGALMLRMARIAIVRKRRLRPFIRSVPLLVVLTLGWSLGEFMGYVVGPADGAGSP